MTYLILVAATMAVPFVFAGTAYAADRFFPADSGRVEAWGRFDDDRRLR